MATMLLCDNGARVIHLELPEYQGRVKERGHIIWDRGKESVALDIAANIEAFHALVSKADVLVEDFEPSSRYQDAVEYNKLKAMNPRLVQCSITAYGKDGSLKNEPGDDDLVMARTGILASQPGFREGPVHVVHPVVSVGAAILAAQGIVSALFAREKTGKGIYVETSLMAGALMFAPKVVGENLNPRPFQLTPAGGGPFYSVFECADGNYVQIGCIHGGFVDLAAAVMGIAHVMTDPRYGDGRRPVDEEARRELFDIVASVIKTKPYHEWAEIFDSADIPFAQACYTEDSLSNPQVIANDMIAHLQDPEFGAVTQMDVPIKFTRTQGKIRGPRAVSGEHTDSVLAEFSSAGSLETPSYSETSEKYDMPLKGISVLEMTNVIAGPTAGKCFADLGAEVIKMEPHYGDISRSAGAPYFLFLNSNKRSVSVDTKTPEGKEIAQRLAGKSDIMLANMRPGATDRMGLSTDELRDINPGIIHAHTTAFGWIGPYSHRPGVDPLAQGWMGLQRAQAGKGNPPVFLAQLAPTDFTSGGLVALGAIMALFVRERTGETQKVDCNLLNAGALLTLEDFTEYEGRVPRRIADKGQYGLSALHRLYETAEGWLYVSAEAQQDWEALCEALGRRELPQDIRFASPKGRQENDVALASELTVAFQKGRAKELFSVLRQANVPCAEVTQNYNVDYFDDEHPISNGMVNEYDHAVYGRMKYASNLVKFGGTSGVKGRPTPLLGEHNREALIEVGYTPQEIETFYDKEILLTEEPSLK